MLAASAVTRPGSARRSVNCMIRLGKAVVCREVNGAPRVERIRIEAPQRHEVMIEVAACGVCHSDLSVLNGTIPIPPPVVLGHEGAGVVSEVGP